jgi:hypothetical protein
MAAEHPSFTRQLFSGTIDDAILFPYPRISEEEDRWVRDFLASWRRTWTRTWTASGSTRTSASPTR